MNFSKMKKAELIKAIKGKIKISEDADKIKKEELKTSRECPPTYKDLEEAHNKLGKLQSTKYNLVNTKLFRNIFVDKDDINVFINNKYKLSIDKTSKIILRLLYKSYDLEVIKKRLYDNKKDFIKLVLDKIKEYHKNICIKYKDDIKEYNELNKIVNKYNTEYDNIKNEKCKRKINDELKIYQDKNYILYKSSKKRLEDIKEALESNLEFCASIQNNYRLLLEGQPKEEPKEVKINDEEIKYKVMNNPTRQLIQNLLKEPLYKIYSLKAYQDIKNNFLGKTFLIKNLEKAKKFNYEPDIKLINKALKIWDSPEFKKNLKIKQEEAKEKRSREIREQAKRFEKEQEEPKEEPKKENNNINNIKLYVNSYNNDEIKKQKLTKENLTEFTNPAIQLLDKIENQLDKIEDKIEFFKQNKELSKKYADTKKNFVRRVKAQLKKNRTKINQKEEPKKEEPKKEEPKEEIKEIKEITMKDIDDKAENVIQQSKEKDFKDSREYYELNRFYQIINTFLTSPSKRNRKYLDDLDISREDRIYLYDAKRGMDFYPTPKICLEDNDLIDIFNNIETIFEPTAGLGNLIFHILGLTDNKNIPNLKIDANEFNDNIYRMLKNKMGKYINNLTNKDYLEMDVNKAYDLTILNPPFTTYKKPKYYLEFLIKAVYDINSNINKNFNFLIFISPPLIEHKKDADETFGFSEILNNMSDKDLIRCLENLTDKKKFSRNDLKYIRGDIYDSSGNNYEVDDDIDDITNKLSMFDCKLVKKCTGFGGTGFTGNVYKFMSYRTN